MPTEPDTEDISLRFRISLLLNDLTHRDKAISEDAEVQIRCMGSKEIPPLIDAFEKEYKTYRARDVRLRHIGSKLQLWSGIVYLAILIDVFVVHVKIPSSIVVPVFIGCSISGFTMRSISRQTPKRLSAIYDLLIRMDKPQIVNVILEMYSADTIWLFLEAQQLLTRHLAHITPEQWKNLTQQQRKALYRLLEQKAQISVSSSYELALAGLEALMQFGDAEAIPTVEYIAKHGSNEKLRDMAKECLPYLHIRREEDSIRQTLLRASQSSSGKDELLRIPTHQTNTENEQLLRMPREE